MHQRDLDTLTEYLKATNAPAEVWQALDHAQLSYEEVKDHFNQIRSTRSKSLDQIGGCLKTVLKEALSSAQIDGTLSKNQSSIIKAALAPLMIDSASFVWPVLLRLVEDQNLGKLDLRVWTRPDEARMNNLMLRWEESFKTFYDSTGAPSAIAQGEILRLYLDTIDYLNHR